MRGVYHRYDLPHLDRDDRQICGRLALLIGAAFVTSVLWSFVTFLVKFFSTALVVVHW